MNPQRPRVSRLQFSLRAVLVVLTLAAIGGWWWQRRFQVVRAIQRRQATGGGVRAVDLTRAESRRRIGLGDAVKDGPTIEVDDDGRLILEEEWRRGVRHGVYRRWNDAGELLFECEFKHGRLIRVGDIAVADFLPAASAADEPKGKRMLRALHRDASFDYLDMPLNSVIEDISFSHNIPIAIDGPGFAADGVDIGTPITSSIRNVPLFVALIELLAPLDLTCAYRYDMLWVTTPDSDLHDDELAPRVIADHASAELLSALTKPVRFDYSDQPLGDVFAEIAFMNHIKIESHVQDESEGVILALREISLRSALGVLLYTHELRCEARGDRLFVTEADGKTPKPKVTPDAVPKPGPPTDSFSDPASDPFTDPISQGEPSDDPFSRR